MTLCVFGRIDAGLAEINAAIAVDPLGPFLWFYRRSCLYVSGRSGTSSPNTSATRLNLTFTYLDSFEGAAYRELGMINESIAAYERDLMARRTLPVRAGDHVAGQPRARGSRRSSKHRDIPADHYYPVEFLGAAFASVGEMDRAFGSAGPSSETRSILWSWLGGGWRRYREEPAMGGAQEASGLESTDGAQAESLRPGGDSQKEVDRSMK